MKFFKRDKTYVIESTGEMIEPSGIPEFIAVAVGKIVEEMARDYLNEHKAELLAGIDHKSVIREMELAIVNKMINR